MVTPDGVFKVESRVVEGTVIPRLAASVNEDVASNEPSLNDRLAAVALAGTAPSA